jgi:hypothetical protein
MTFESGVSSQEAGSGALPQATGGRRITWAAVPEKVAAGIERLLGGKVVGAASQPGGFSEGLAARVRLAGGGGAFVKAASTLTAPAVAAFHCREIEISRRLPPTVPAPQLLDAYDDGDWVTLIFEEIPGRLPAQPWRRDELERVLATITDVTRILTPSPVEEALLSGPRLGGWAALANGSADIESVLEKIEALSPVGRPATASCRSTAWARREMWAAAGGDVAAASTGPPVSGAASRVADSRVAVMARYGETGTDPPTDGYSTL